MWWPAVLLLQAFNDLLTKTYYICYQLFD